MKSLIKTNGLVEQHIHGGFGIDFNKCSADDIISFAKKLPKYGISAFFPTLVTDSTENLKKQIQEIKTAQKKHLKNSAIIIGVHLEGPFINPEKKGIHNTKHILKPTIDDFKKIEDKIIKIVTIAPELDYNYELSGYLKSKNIKISAGHTLASEINFADQVTHLFNAMDGINHKKQSTATSALIDDNIYTEVIADSIHINDDVLKLIFKLKPIEKIILISDALPITHSAKDKITFSGEEIFLDNNTAKNKYGTIAGSTMLLNDIIKNVVSKNILDFNKAIEATTTNIRNYHNIKNNAYTYWDENLNIVKTEFID